VLLRIGMKYHPMLLAIVLVAGPAIARDAQPAPSPTPSDREIIQPARAKAAAQTAAEDKARPWDRDADGKRPWERKLPAK
jgi:hypothetical protein